MFVRGNCLGFRYDSWLADFARWQFIGNSLLLFGMVVVVVISLLQDARIIGNHFPQLQVEEKFVC